MMFARRLYVASMLVSVARAIVTAELAAEKTEASGAALSRQHAHGRRAHRAIIRSESGVANGETSSGADARGDNVVESLAMQKSRDAESRRSLMTNSDKTSGGASLIQERPNFSASPPLVLYGIETCSAKKYTDIVDAVFETWAKNVPRKHVIMVGGLHDDAKKGLTKVPMICPDTVGSLSCKETVLLFRAVERAVELDAQWLAVLQEDKFVSPAKVASTLQGFDSSKAMVLGPFGCGRGLKGYCQSVHDGAGLCGGDGYFISRGALDRILLKDQTVHELVNETKAMCPTCADASDMSSSCLFHKRGLPMSAPNFVSLMGEAPVERPFSEETQFTKGVSDLVDRFGGKAPMTVHLNFPKESIPGYIRKLHERLREE